MTLSVATDKDSSPPVWPWGEPSETGALPTKEVLPPPPTESGQSSPPSYDPENEWQAALRELQVELDEYEKIKGSADKTRLMIAEALVVAAMRKLARIHPDRKVQKEWTKRADAFAKGNQEDKENILKGVGKGLGILLLTPIGLAGAVLFAAGAILYGTGELIVGIGHVLTFGQLRKRLSK